MGPKYSECVVNSIDSIRHGVVAADLGLRARENAGSSVSSRFLKVGLIFTSKGHNRIGP